MAGRGQPPVAECPDPALFAAPAEIQHYETGPETTRSIELGGRLWAVTYHAAWDGIGWLVKRISVASLEEEAPGSIRRPLRPGDLVDVRAKLVADQGSHVEILIENEGPGFYSNRFWLRRSKIVRILRPEEPETS